MAGSDQPIKGLKVTVSDLIQAGDGANLPASAVRVRYAVPATPDSSWVPAYRFDGLLGAIPAEIPVIEATPPRAGKFYHPPVERKSLVPGAVAPLWFMVRVPKDAKAGVYEGTVTVAAEGLQPATVPMRVHVCDWMMMHGDQPFVSMNPMDFNLRPDSAAVDAGAAGKDKEYHHQSRGKAPDLGAIELGETWNFPRPGPRWAKGNEIPNRPAIPASLPRKWVGME
jgi:hypothetical protein